MSSVLPLYWMTHPKCQVKASYRTLFRCVFKVTMELIILKILSKYFHVCVLFRYWRCFWIFGFFMLFFFCLFIFFFKHMSSWIFWHRQYPAISLTVSWIFKIQWKFSDCIVIYSTFRPFLWHIHWCFEYNVIALYILF